MGRLFSRALRIIRRQGLRIFLMQFFQWLRARMTLLRIPAMRFPTLPSDQFARVKNSQDYVRYLALGLAVQRVLREDISGDIAEAGVWRGDCARFLHIFAPDRVLYLFDTFEGYPGQEQTINLNTNFRDTSIRDVRKIVGDSSNIIIKKGIFPATTVGIEHNKFACVSLDMNTYEAMIEGWKFFYPRMSRGGFIFVHDFNNTVSDNGTFRATTEFLSDKPEKIIELPDPGGSALIRKI